MNDKTCSTKNFKMFSFVQYFLVDYVNWRLYIKSMVVAKNETVWQKYKKKFNYLFSLYNF